MVTTLVRPFGRALLRAPAPAPQWAVTRTLVSTPSLRADKPAAPAASAAASAARPPRGVDDSTSALDYKLQHRLRKLPPLPSLEPPTMDASEAVSNILYNTPPPSTQPFKR